MKKASDAAISEADIKKGATMQCNRARRSSRQALNIIKDKLASPEVVKGIGKLTDAIPKLADVIVKAVDFVTKSPVTTGSAAARQERAPGHVRRPASAEMAAGAEVAAVARAAAVVEGRAAASAALSAQRPQSSRPRWPHMRSAASRSITISRSERRARHGSSAPASAQRTSRAS
jgi:hypothetical protein